MAIVSDRFKEVFVKHNRPRRVCVGDTQHDRKSVKRFLVRRSTILVHQLEPDVSAVTTATNIDFSRMPRVKGTTMFDEGIKEKNLRKGRTTFFWNQPPKFGRKKLDDMPDESFWFGKRPDKLAGNKNLV